MPVLLVMLPKPIMIMLMLLLMMVMVMMVVRVISSNRRNARRGVTNVRITICDRHRSLTAPGGPLQYFYYFDYLLIISSIEISPSS